jgi:hypothetical protein
VSKLSAHRVPRDSEARENVGRDAILLPQQTEQDVLGAYVFVPQGVSLMPSEIDSLPSQWRETLEHRRRIVVARRGCASRSRCSAVSVTAAAVR